jgi:hypothetical protein
MDVTTHENHVSASNIDRSNLVKAGQFVQNGPAPGGSPDSAALPEKALATRRTPPARIHYVLTLQFTPHCAAVVGACSRAASAPVKPAL